MFANLLSAAAIAASPLPAQDDAPTADPAHELWTDQCEDWDEWDKPGPAYKIFGNTYYVGTCGISAILITGENGHVLIDTGTRKGAEIVARNIAQLGYDLSDVKVMLHSHEHFDHVGGFAWMQRKTGAAVIGSDIGARVLQTGIVVSEDPQHGMHDPMMPVIVSSTISGGDVVEGGNTRLIAIDTPGHTPGALSWQWTSCEGAICVRFIYADSLSPVSSDAYKFSDHPAYVATYREGLDQLRAAQCDVLLTPHPTSSRMPERLLGPTGLLGSENCKAYPDLIEARLDKRLAKEGEKASGE